MAVVAAWAQPTAVKNRAFFEGISYNWPFNAPTTAQQSSNLGQVATDPDQIIAMLREIYMNQTIPGNYTRGYSALGSPEGTWTNGVATGTYPVAYPAVGAIAYDGENYSYVNSSGWDIPGDVVKLSTIGEPENVTFVAGVDKTPLTHLSKGEFHIRYIGNLNISYYLMSYGYDNRFATSPGYEMTNVKFTFTAAGYGSSNIDYVRYRNADGNMVRIDRTTTPNITEFMPAGGLEFIWTIPTDSLVIRNASNQNLRVTQIEATYRAKAHEDGYFNKMSYLPNEEGNTVLLVEVKDGVTPTTLKDAGLATFINNGFDTYNITDYASLRNVIAATIKSVRVLTDAKRMGEGLDAGTLFKIDCDKLNRFFLLGKGQLRWFNNDYKDSDVNATNSPRYETPFVDRQPYYKGSTFFDQSIENLFGHMFEQFSPSSSSGGSSVNDIYQDLVKMNSFNVLHDCIDVLSAESTGHEFNMYGKTSISDDCQDVRDMMFFLPDYRMLIHTGTNTNSANDDRDPNKAQRFINYSPTHAPKLALFVIKQNAITGQKQSNANVYNLNLSWTSNLQSFLPSSEGVYKLYRVVTNADGTKTYTVVADNLASNTFSYVDQVPMEQNGQVVTYAVQGQDSEEFLSLQMSNEQSFVIPGLDKKEKLRIALNKDYYYSRYDAANQRNNYSNSIVVTNVTGAGVKTNHLKKGSQFKFWRATLDENGNIIEPENPFVVAEVTSYTSTNGNNSTVTFKNWNYQSTFSLGYHTNKATATLKNSNGEIVFNNNGLQLYDNFSVDINPANDHPAQYVYYVTLETAVDFETDEGTSNQVTSNTVTVPVYKTSMTMNPISEQQVLNDDNHQAPAYTSFDVNARYSSKSEILGYYIYRWADSKVAVSARSIYESNGADASPQGQAGNQSTYYTVAMNTDYTGQTEYFTTDANGNHPDVTASFHDNFMVNQKQDADTYTYAPVVELFAPQSSYVAGSSTTLRTDYNTYGGPQQMTAGGLVDVQVIKYAPSEHSWTANGNTYRYYVVSLKIDPNKDIVPEGYVISKVRAWRQINTDYLGEERGKGYENRVNADYMFINQNDCQKGEELGMEQIGTSNGPIYRGTFGAVELGTNDAIPVKFIVRVYFTKANAQGSPMLKEVASQPYYIAETVIDDEITYQVPTSIYGVGEMREVNSVKYYNLAGVESDVPFTGLNIVVTRYSDGTTTTAKVVK